MKKYLMLLGFSMILTGCAFTPQTVSIQPQISVSPSRLGNDQPVSLNVVDERPKKTLGTVGAGSVGADITIDGDLVTVIQNSVRDGLSRMAFRPSFERNADASELRVEIRNLDYTIIMGFWAGTLRVDAGLKGICIKDGMRPYEKLHHGEFVESVQVVQSQEANTQYINKAVSSAVNSLLADRDLMACLAGPRLPASPSANP